MAIDHYEVLGVHPSAEELIIRAAYRALAQRYHPDKLGPDEKHLADRMAQVNEAYRVLSDPVRRKEYDDSRETESASPKTALPLDDLFDPPPSGTSFASADWEKACEYFPDLKDIDTELTRISWKLAWMFQSALLESKTFERRKDLAVEIERIFLEIYFGTNSEIILFAKRLILAGLRDAAQELSHATSILGSQTEPKHLILRVLDKFNITPESFPETRARKPSTQLKKLCHRFQRGEQSQLTTTEILHRVFEEADIAYSLFGKIKGVRAWGRTYQFTSNNELLTWVYENIVKPVLREEPLGSWWR